MDHREQPFVSHTTKMKIAEKMKKILLVCALTILGGCAAPSPDELARADYGAYPDQYKELIEGYMGRILKDPYSAHYEYLNAPVMAWRKTMSGPIYGYAVCVNINAKNSYGGYTGAQPSYFMFHDGVITYAMHGDSGTMGTVVANLCDKLTPSTVWYKPGHTVDNSTPAHKIYEKYRAEHPSQ